MRQLQARDATASTRNTHGLVAVSLMAMRCSDLGAVGSLVAVRIQALLEKEGVPFVGTGSASSKQAFDKVP